MMGGKMWGAEGMTEKDRAKFWARVIPNGTGCWGWVGPRGPTHAVQFSAAGRRRMAHRVVYELVVGPIPPSLVLDHTCHTKSCEAAICPHRSCVNPWHLEAVTQQENSRRGRSGIRQLTRTHCPKGHPYAEANLIVNIKGARLCRECTNANARKYTARRRAQRETTDA